MPIMRVMMRPNHLAIVRNGVRNSLIIREMGEKEVIEACKLIINFLDSEMEEDGLMSESLENQLYALEDRLKW